MKLSQKTEWGIIAVLIAYLAFTPCLPMISNGLSTPLGKAAALVAIVYIWKYVSQIIAILFILNYVRCAKSNIWEMFSGAEQTCVCEASDHMWDPAVKKCKSADGKEGKVKYCTCMNGYSWDGSNGKNECIPSTDNQPPVPPSAIPANSSTTAPAVSTGPVTSTAPMTTPSATQAMVTSTPPSIPSTTGGVQPNIPTSTVSPV